MCVCVCAREQVHTHTHTHRRGVLVLINIPPGGLCRFFDLCSRQMLHINVRLAAKLALRFHAILARGSAALAYQRWC